MSDKKRELIRALKFFLFSTSAGIIQTLSFALMNEALEWNYSLCYLTALVLSVLWNFTFNRKFTFQAANNIPIAMLNVAAFYLVFTPLSTWGGQTLESNGWNEYIVLGLSMLTNLVTEYFYQRYIVFGKISPKMRKAWRVTTRALAGLSALVLVLSAASALFAEPFFGKVGAYLWWAVRTTTGFWAWVVLPAVLFGGLVVALIIDRYGRKKASKLTTEE